MGGRGVCARLVELDVARVEPRLERLEVLHVDRVDLQRLDGKVLEHQHLRDATHAKRGEGRAALVR